MHRVLLLGAGKIGRMIARLLVDSGDYGVIVGDVSSAALERIARRTGVETRQLDVESAADLAGALAGCDTVISALSYFYNPGVAEAALAVRAAGTGRFRRVPRQPLRHALRHADLDTLRRRSSVRHRGASRASLSGFLMRQVPAGRLWSARKHRCIRERSVRALRPHENRRAS